MPTATDASLDALGSFAVDRSSPVPLYFQVAQHLEHAIDSGALPPGTLLLNEIALADALKLSRPTMRRAMQTLVDKGLVVRRRGIGTRVVQPKMRRPLGAHQPARRPEARGPGAEDQGALVPAGPGDGRHRTKADASSVVTTCSSW